MAERKGASRRADIPPTLRRGLNNGTVEARTLAEALAVDFACLMKAAFPEAKHQASRLDPALGIVARMTEGGKILLETLRVEGLDTVLEHPSDTVRGWGAFALGQAHQLDLATMLTRVQPWADDPNAGVREWAWLGVRNAIAADPLRAVELLTPWTGLPSERLRRFASESTRPRGVWCAHLRVLKEKPSLGLNMLEPLRADPSKYVQDSVSNWLNDAAKSDPAWVQTVCRRWQTRNAPPATLRICRRALRSIER